MGRPLVLRHLLIVMFLTLLVGTGTARGSALFDESALANQGYTRQYVGVNLQDVPETLDDDRYALSMVRTQFLLRSDLRPTEWLEFHSRLRAAREYETNYLASLQDPDELTPVSEGGAAGVIPRNGARSPEFYETFVGENDLEVRELYLDLNVTRNLQLRTGKQLVAWGKGSLERALDLVQGFDGSWLPFASDEEERRKSTTMARMFYRFPARSATLEVFYQPGWDELHDLENSSDQGGGRNTANGIRGLDTTEPLFLPDLGSDVFLRITRPTNPHNDGADVNDEKFGLRWQGLGLGNAVEYSLAYLHTHQKSTVSHHVLDPYRSTVIDTGDPRCDPLSPGLSGDLLENGFDQADDGSLNGSVGCLESGRRYENVLPIIDVFGGSFNYYSPTFNTVVRGELAYLKDRLFNRKPEDPTLQTLNDLSDQTTLFTDQISKDEYRIMLGFDRTAYFAEWLLGSDRPGLVVVEFFDFMIDDFEPDEKITSTLKGDVKEHTLEMVASASWNYWNGWLAPRVRAAVDLSYGGNAILLPGFTVSPSTAWKLNLTGVFVLEDTDRGTRATKFGATGDADRLITQVTYQF